MMKINQSSQSSQILSLSLTVEETVAEMPRYTFGNTLRLLASLHCSAAAVEVQTPNPNPKLNGPVESLTLDPSRSSPASSFNSDIKKKADRLLKNITDRKEQIDTPLPAALSQPYVLAELRTPGVWFDGVDWAAGGLDIGGKREDDSLSSTSASTRSDGSHTTSPVLSMTMLHTTPSPPPSHPEEKEHEPTTTTATAQPKPPQVIIPIPVSPVLDSPKLLHPIPYVPVTLAHMAQYSLEAFKQVWRKACAPLYHCLTLSFLPRTSMPPKHPRRDSDRPVDDQARHGESVAPIPTPRQRKRSSEELDVGNDSLSRGDSLQKRLHIEESSLGGMGDELPDMGEEGMVDEVIDELLKGKSRGAAGAAIETKPRHHAGILPLPYAPSSSGEFTRIITQANDVGARYVGCCSSLD
ncbi:uncharacterized protein HD556DRAFT_1496950 [Suillus plorans]|uniref:Uncharacterized protein n=1 Tax=Suillus plorans TaxID=116603 RepID=A0A9P7AHH7_9AGAM|nr:uncharacterized protein HD556DRAFT_1496950 [Suillus plorans]KAG1788585.1 hypothetical protein HD556DRAFT_1496950 [Suillus plorans]